MNQSTQHNLNSMPVLAVVTRLLRNGLSPLPVAPAHPAEQYPALDKNGQPKKDKSGALVPAFTGKNPSYLDADGKPQSINHNRFQNKQPTAHINLWFQNSRNGVGCLGGQNKRFIDFDSKHFESEAECDRVVLEWQSNNPQLEGARFEKTQSGGFRVWVEFSEPDTFTNFSLADGGPHVGEILGPGRFAVLAPTVGPSGRPYEIIQDGSFAAVKSPESIGLYPVKRAPAAAKAAKPKPRRVDPIPGTLPLELLAKDSTRAVLNGQASSDRSSDLTAAVKEWQGWENWCSKNSVNYSQSAEELTHRAGEALEIDSERVDRILQSIDLEKLSACLCLCRRR